MCIHTSTYSPKTGWSWENGWVLGSTHSSAPPGSLKTPTVACLPPQLPKNQLMDKLVVPFLDGRELLVSWLAPRFFLSRRYRLKKQFALTFQNNIWELRPLYGVVLRG